MTEILKEFYVREINLVIESFFDSGWQVSIGDTINGFKEGREFGSVTEMELWLKEYLARLPALTEAEKKFREK